MTDEKPSGPIQQDPADGTEIPTTTHMRTYLVVMFIAAVILTLLGVIEVVAGVHKAVIVIVLGAVFAMIDVLAALLAKRKGRW